MPPKLDIDRERIAAFCRKWKIPELALFGSVLRDDFGPESDVDVLVTLAEDAHYGLRELFAMEQELSEVFGREVDFVTRRSVEASENWIRRRIVLDSAELLYVA
ncbi:MAG: nucleotidyltransferase domain-containing protein [Phycisphaerae bacterium]